MHASSLLLTLGVQAAAARSLRSTQHLFSSPDLAVREASTDYQVQLGSHTRPGLKSPPLSRGSLCKRDGNVTTNTIFGGVYPVVNVTWGNKDSFTSSSSEKGGKGQSFVSYIDTGSADTFAVSSKFVCRGTKGGSQGGSSQGQSECNFGPLYDAAAGNYTNITSQSFSISYFPEMVSLAGSMVLAPISVGALEVQQQQAALVEAATWVGDGVTSGLLGMGYPAVTSSHNRSTGQPAPGYSPFFTSLIQQGVPPVFSLAIDRVPRGTPPWADAGRLALGGLVPARYYEGSFTSVPIEALSFAEDSSERAFYATTVEVVYNGSSTSVPLKTSSSFQTIVDSGTSPNFVPTEAAAAINSLFEPPAVFNETWTSAT